MDWHEDEPIAVRWWLAEAVQQPFRHDCNAPEGVSSNRTPRKPYRTSGSIQTVAADGQPLPPGRLVMASLRKRLVP